MASIKSRKALEFGDFQTPMTVTRKLCKLLADRGIAPATLIEPTCGIGNFLLAALDQFPKVSRALGIEINQGHADKLIAALRTRSDRDKVEVIRDSFFHTDLAALLRDLPEPVLAIGNPPWVTNAQLGLLGSTNLPKKTNFQNYNGLAALTGKSNFDISEWILIRLLEVLQGRRAVIAMLCKTAVARKALMHAWKNRINLEGAEIRTIDATTLFGAAVDACLLLCTLAPCHSNPTCCVFRRLDDKDPAQTIGYQDGSLIADLAAYERSKHLSGKGGYQWRSGIKHDCSKVMELRRQGSRYLNGLGELVELEDDYLFPMLKSSEVAKGRTKSRNRWMLVTQRTVGEDTSMIRQRAPKTWQYLQKHGEALDRRASSIYRNRPRFSVFGVGAYSFSPWKVAISGFYRNLQFTVIGSVNGKPTVLDDTCYFIPCQTEQEALLIVSILNSSSAREFFSAFVFWDAKRPITIDLLQRLDLFALARVFETDDELRSFWQQRHRGESSSQRDLFEALAEQDAAADGGRDPSS